MSAGAPWFSFPDFFLSFAALLLEGIPFLLLGALGSAAVDLFLPEAWLRRLLGLGRGGGIAAGYLAGFLFPICECGALPIVMRLLRKGVPLPVAATYLFAAPLLNPFSIASTWFAFRSQNPWLWVVLRLFLGSLLILSLSLWISRCDTREILRPLAEEAPSEPVFSAGGEILETPWRRRLRRTVRSVTDDFLAVLFFLVIGAAVAAFLNTSINRGWINTLAQHALFGPVVAVGLAQTLSICSTTDAFIIAALPQFPMAAALAFLIAGPLFDLKLFWIYQALFTRFTVLQIWLRVTAGALLLCWLYSLL